MNGAISFVKSATDIETRDVRVEKVLEAIRTGGKNGKGKVEQIRNRFDAELAIASTRAQAGENVKPIEAAKEAVAPLKKQLSGVTWSAQLSTRDKDVPLGEKLVAHSGMLCADFDLLGPELETVRKKLKASPHLFALFRSPTGNGLKAVFRVCADASKHLGSFRAVKAHVKQLTGLDIDESCKDVARLCFMSYDPQIYINENAIELEPLPEPEKRNSTPNAEINLSERQRVAGEVVAKYGSKIIWISPSAGYLEPCPGQHLHTAGNAERDCKIDLDRVPTTHCFHDHCRAIIDAINRELRSRIGKEEYQARRETPRSAVQSQEAPEPPSPPPAPYVPPPLDLLPSVLQDYVHAAAESLNVDVAFILLPLLSSLGTGIGNSRSIILKRGFIQPPVIWTAVIQRSGYLKSPAIEAGCFAVMEHEHELMRENNKAQEIYENDLAEWKAKKPAQRGAESAPAPPPFLTCAMDDLTIEALADVLAMNPRGVLVAKDEISHWFASFDQYRSHGKGSDVSRWLSLHTAVHFALDRRTDRRHLRVRDPRANITGGIQPKVLDRVLTPDFFERGLPARFIFAFPPADKIRWSEATIPDRLQNATLELFEEIWLLQPGRDKHGASRPELLGLDKDAKAAYVPFYNECGEWAIAGNEKEEAAWNKLGGYAARFALVGQVARNTDATTVTGNLMAAACDLARWSGKESARIYATLAETPQQREQRELIEFIKRRGGTVSERDLVTYHRPIKNLGAGGTEKATEMLNGLVRVGCGEWIEARGKRGPATRNFRYLDVSASAGFQKTPSIASKPADADSPSSRENIPSGEPQTEAVSDKMDAMPGALADAETKTQAEEKMRL